MSLPEGSIGNVIHDQERRSIFDSALKHMDNVRMPQFSNRLRLIEKTFHAVTCKVKAYQLDGRLRFEEDVLS